MSNAISGPRISPPSSRMPPIGVGTGPISPYSPTQILAAIELGYRHIQTFISNAVEHHGALREAINEALKRKLVNSRDEIYVTCRIEYNSSGDNTIVHDLKKFLEKAEIEHVDLLIIHWLDSNISDADLKSAWKAMEECQMLGLAKSIGTSDLSSSVLKNILEFAEIRPSTNQVDMEMFLNEKEEVRFCMSSKISMIVRCRMDGKHKFEEMVGHGASLLLEDCSTKEDLQMILQMFP